MYTMDKRKKSKVNQAIDALIKDNEGRVSKELIVNAAQVEGSVLHENFKKRGLFDPSKAMYFAQLTYAGMLITQYHVWVQVEDKAPVKVRALVSLTPDRKVEGGGYRHLATVMSNTDTRDILLSDAKRELQSFKIKYQVLSELAPVFSAIDSL